jgi:hypothetical protein
MLASRVSSLRGLDREVYHAARAGTVLAMFPGMNAPLITPDPSAFKRAVCLADDARLWRHRAQQEPVGPMNRRCLANAQTLEFALRYMADSILAEAATKRESTPCSEPR